MYNTVGETAGVTQDVGSDPTVSGFCGFCWCCTLCGREIVGEEEGRFEMEMEDEDKDKVKTVDIGMIDLAEMSRFEHEDMEMDEEGTEDATWKFEQRREARGRRG